MARVLAIDWDGHEARCVLGSASGGKIQVVAANSAPLVNVAQGGGQSRPDVAGSLRAALGDERPGRITTIVGVNRASVDLMNFTLPPAKDRELAQLVQIQAAREIAIARRRRGVGLSADEREPGRAAGSDGRRPPGRTAEGN